MGLPPCGRGPGRNPGQGNHTRSRPSARRQRRCRPQTHTARVPATHARRRRPKTINGAYHMQGSSGPLQMHPASQLRLYGVLRSSARSLLSVTRALSALLVPTGRPLGPRHDLYLSDAFVAALAWSRRQRHSVTTDSTDRHHHPYQGCVVGPIVNSLTFVSSG
jgi:hypothetical protein